MASTRPVGVIGLDKIGRALARRLAAKGMRVEAYDMKSDMRRAFAEGQPAAHVAESLTDLGVSCDMVVSTLVDASALRAAAVGDHDRPGFALAMRPGSIIIHFGGGPYRDIVRMTGQLGTGGVGLIDALACADANPEDSCPMDMLVGGYGEFIDRARPVLDALGSFARVGDTGTATGLSALRGYVRAARLIALSEAMLIGRHAGISADTLARVFDGPVAAGPSCRSLLDAGATLLHSHDLGTTCSSVTDAVAFSERIGVSGECVAFARDMLADAMSGENGGDESTLLRHFAAIASADM